MYKYILLLLLLSPFRVGGESMRGLYVGELYSIVTSDSETQRFVNFIKTNEFTGLNFYTGGKLETRVITDNDKGKELQFASLLSKLVRETNVKEFNIAIGSPREMDRVMAFITKYGVLITGFVLEYEWWNNKPRDFENAVTLLKYIRNRGGYDRKIGAYIGWTERDDIAQLIPLVDRILMHAYVPDGKKTYDKLKTRLNQIKAAQPSKKVPVYPIFSAEWLPPEICNQGTGHPSFYDNMCFMGPWLKNNGGLKGAERAFARSEAAGRTSADNWRAHATISGFYYYSYTHLRDALE